MNEYTEQTGTTSKSTRDSKSLIIGLLIAAIVILAGFFIFDHSKSTQNLKEQ